ncbi:MAG: NADPH-dependent FMN reductase [Saprospiraceae bacterium]
MITVISGTNRKGSKSLIFAKQYVEILQQQTEEEVALVALEELPQDWMSVDMYSADHQANSISEIQDKYIFPAEKFMIVSSEYNGSFPGVLKFFIDALSIRQYPKNFKGKKIAMAGVADGRAGNLRGMGHLIHIFNHVGGITMPAQMPYSSISKLIEDGKITDADTLKTMKSHAQQLIDF